MHYPKKELLSPAGDYESFLAALENGADAVYLSGTSFGARAYAKNFTNEELQQAIKTGHLYGVKVYITMNTIVKEEEVSSFLSQVSFLYQLGVDAIIMQDIGMICLCKEMFPELEIHASTQCNCSTIESIRILEEIGVKRVVFPREMSLDTIQSIQTSLEKEIFIHGALCVSYSGNCLFSSLHGGRSANRGECAGCCRLPFTLLEKNKKINEGYLLSMKDLHTAPSFEEILKSDIKSLKIEGRMKSSSYVAYVTQYYRKLCHGEVPNSQDLKILKILFYREFTTGHLFGEKNLMNPRYSNHLGLLIGMVQKVTKKEIIIRLSEDLYQEDGIRFQKSKKGFVVNYLYDEHGKLVSSIKKGNLAVIRNTIGLTEKDEVFKTSSKHLEKSLKKVSKRKVPIEMTFIAHVGKKMKLLIKDQDHHVVEVLGSIVEDAKKSAVSKKEFYTLLTRLKDTPFQEEKVNLDIDSNVFVRLGDINDLRRRGIQQMIKKRTEVGKKPIVKSVSFSKNEKPLPKQMTVLVKTEKDIKKALFSHFSRIYVENQSLWEKYSSFENIYFALSRNQWKRTDHAKRIWSEELRKNAILGYSLNVSNAYSVYYLSKLGATSVCLSVELTDEEQEMLLRSAMEKFGYLPIEMIVKGRIEIMVIKGNPLQIMEGKQYQLRDIKGNEYPVIYHDSITSIYQNKIINKMDQIHYWHSLGVSSFCQIK